MNLFWSTRAKRNTAFKVLPLWLFALVSGFANACLLEVPEAHSHGITFESSASAEGQAASHPHAHSESDHHADAATDHGDDSGASKAPCLKVCDDGSHSLPTQRSGVDQADHGVVAVAAVLWTVPAPIVSNSYRVDDLQFPVPGPPLRVRYSRLTL